MLVFLITWWSSCPARLFAWNGRAAFPCQQKGWHALPFSHFWFHILRFLFFVSFLKPTHHMSVFFSINTHTYMYFRILHGLEPFLVFWQEFIGLYSKLQRQCQDWNSSCMAKAVLLYRPEACAGGQPTSPPLARPRPGPASRVFLRSQNHLCNLASTWYCVRFVCFV